MKLQELKQRPLETTLMGVVQAVAKYYDYDYTVPWLYGATGHAFLVNVHEVLCPSSPYCWTREPFIRLLANLGIKMTEFGFFGGSSSQSERAELEKRIMKLVDDGVPCSLLNMENQLITGYDSTGLHLSQPFHGIPETVTPAHLEFGSWKPFEELHFDFYSFEKAESKPKQAMVRESLAYALDLYSNPSLYTDEPYAVGPRAYANWIRAVEDGHGGEHGAWWNATVWAECRMMAARYLGEVASEFPDLAEQIGEVGRLYAKVGTRLNEAGNRDMAAAEKIELLRTTAALEANCIEKIGVLASQMSA